MNPDFDIDYDVVAWGIFGLLMGFVIAVAIYLWKPREK